MDKRTCTTPYNTPYNENNQDENAEENEGEKEWGTMTNKRNTEE